LVNRQSSFVICHSSIVICHLSFVVRRSSFVVCHSSFVICPLAWVDRDPPMSPANCVPAGVIVPETADAGQKTSNQ
jgi:hypothetical protein